MSSWSRYTRIYRGRWAGSHGHCSDLSRRKWVYSPRWGGRRAFRGSHRCATRTTLRWATSESQSKYSSRSINEWPPRISRSPLGIQKTAPSLSRRGQLARGPSRGTQCYCVRVACASWKRVWWLAVSSQRWSWCTCFWRGWPARTHRFPRWVAYWCINSCPSRTWGTAPKSICPLARTSWSNSWTPLRTQLWRWGCRRWATWWGWGCRFAGCNWPAR